MQKINREKLQWAMEIYRTDNIVAYTEFIEQYGTNPIDYIQEAAQAFYDITAPDDEDSNVRERPFDLFVFYKETPLYGKVPETVEVFRPIYEGKKEERQTLNCEDIQWPNTVQIHRGESPIKRTVVINGIDTGINAEDFFPHTLTIDDLNRSFGVKIHYENKDYLRSGKFFQKIKIKE